MSKHVRQRGLALPPTTGLESDILSQLRKQARTSTDLVKVLNCEAAEVYRTLAEMRTASLIETRRDPLDGEIKNFEKLTLSHGVDVLGKERKRAAKA